MHENSRTGETSENVENSDEKPNKTEEVSDYLQNQNVLVGVSHDVRSGPSGNQVSERCGSSIDASGSSSYLPPPKYEENVDSTMEISEERVEEQEEEEEENDVVEHDTVTMTSQVPSYKESTDYEPRVRMAPEVEEQQASRSTAVGPPPSYSFVMKQKRKVIKPKNVARVEESSETFLPVRPLPPTYSGNRRLFETPETIIQERNFTLPSFTEPTWRSHSQPALCPRCGILIITTTHAHDSVATHVTALALCLFGCWPCCLLPYCMSVCKNTYHHCPICQTFLGAYTPW